ncbi:PepSY domain-containing protein [Nocardioides sp. MJB4]|uniref:PepSY domain-containing protein n=2 Tax=Nocardioides donggukensis TaxID=2774019 RepID=A0A927Q371_9ACTN|nr:PepSY domain-containing protein [Nocardioides donggukensis]
MHLSKRRAGVLVGAVVAVAVGVGGAAVAGSGGDDDAGDREITGPALQEAEREALAETGEGRVTGTEVEDEESYYEVEVTLEDGSQVDVQLDESFQVVGTEADDESGGD